MAAVTKCAIHRHLAGLGCEHLQDFRHHDGPVSAGRGFAGCENLGDRVGVTMRVVFLVFLLETTRIPAGITLAPLVRHRRWV